MFIGPHAWGADRRLKLPAELTSRESTERGEGHQSHGSPRGAATEDPEPLSTSCWRPT